MSQAKPLESLSRIRQKIKEKIKDEGLSERVITLKMIEELILEQVNNENSRRPTR